MDRGFVERTLRLGPGARLVGTLTEPSSGATGSDRPALLILNTGATPRSGPGRAAVELARKLAALGVRSLRLDLGGLGDSAPGPGERAVDIYRRAALAEVRAAVDLLARRGSDTVVAMGVCSGAFMAFHAALADPRLVGLVLVNLPRFSWRPFHPLVFVRTRTLLALLGRPATWWRALFGRGELLPALRVLAERLGARLVARLPGPLRRAAWAASAPGRQLHALLRRGVRLLVVCAAEDPASATLDRLLGLARGPVPEGGLEIRVVAGASHTFADPGSRSLLLQLVRSHLDRHWPGRSGATGTARPAFATTRALGAAGPIAPPVARAGEHAATGGVR
ncbi:MAG: alpha/beta hydrolase [Geminicoccaceae bacterium]|nr:alpha/beta hydrolase [Geminicoccaceae bacterium]